MVDELPAMLYVAAPIGTSVKTPPLQMLPLLMLTVGVTATVTPEIAALETQPSELVPVVV